MNVNLTPRGVAGVARSGHPETGRAASRWVVTAVTPTQSMQRLLMLLDLSLSGRVSMHETHMNVSDGAGCRLPDGDVRRRACPTGTADS